MKTLKNILTGALLTATVAVAPQATAHDKWGISCIGGGFTYVCYPTKVSHTHTTSSRANHEIGRSTTRPSGCKSGGPTTTTRQPPTGTTTTREGC